MRLSNRRQSAFSEKALCVKKKFWFFTSRKFDPCRRIGLFHLLLV